MRKLRRLGGPTNREGGPQEVRRNRLEPGVTRVLDKRRFLLPEVPEKVPGPDSD